MTVSSAEAFGYDFRHITARADETMDKLFLLWFLEACMRHKSFLLNKDNNDVFQEMCHRFVARYADEKTTPDRSSYDDVPETGSTNPSDTGVVSLLPPRQDDDIHMTDDQDILPLGYLSNGHCTDELGLPPSLSRRWSNISDNDDQNIPLQLYTPNYQRIDDVPLNQYYNDIPRTRGPGHDFPRQACENRMITDAGQTSNVHGQINRMIYQPSKAGRRKALLIGISYRQKLPSDRGLKMPWRDVGLMKSLLIEVYHYKPEDIVVMTDEPHTPRYLQPDRANILREISNLVQNPADRDDFFFYYAGHATQRNERIKGNERDKLDECLVPLDAAESEDYNLLIVDDDLHLALVQPLIQADVDCQLYAVMDTCTSGTLLDLKHDLCNEIRLTKDFWKKVLKMPIRSWGVKTDTGSLSFCGGNCDEEGDNLKANIICLSACKDSQSIMEYQNGGTLACVLNDLLRHEKRPSLGELYPQVCSSIKDVHKRLLLAERRRLQDEEAHQSQSPGRRMPTKSPSPQITSIKPLKGKMLFRPTRANSSCH